MKPADFSKLLKTTLEDAKAVEVNFIDLQGKSSLTDFVVIASGTSSRHVISIARKLVEAIKPVINHPVGQEGTDKGDWVVLDFGDAIVHLFKPEVRSFYRIEELWADDIDSVKRPTTKIQL